MLRLPLKSDDFSARIRGAIERMLETKRITVKAPPLPVADFLTKYTDLAKLRHLSKAAGQHNLLTDSSVDPA